MARCALDGDCARARRALRTGIVNPNRSALRARLMPPAERPCSRRRVAFSSASRRARLTPWPIAPACGGNGVEKSVTGARSRPPSCVCASRGRRGRGSPARASPRSMVRGWASPPSVRIRPGLPPRQGRATWRRSLRSRNTPPPQFHESAAATEQPTPSSAKLAKSPVRPREGKDVEAVACRQREAAGQVDPEAAVEARAPADRQRAVFSRRVARKVEAERARGGLDETAGDGKRRQRRDLQRTLVDHGSVAAVDRDVVAERGIAAGEGEVSVADRDRRRPSSGRRLCPRRR